MPRGGVRPGAGRPRKITAAGAAAAFKPPKPVAPSKPVSPPQVALSPDDPGHPLAVLMLVARGITKDAAGKPITPQRIAAAKELLPFFEGKRSAVSDKRGLSKPLHDLTDDELRAIISDELPEDSGSGTIGAAPSAPVVCPFCRESFTPTEPGAGAASEDAVSEATGDSGW